MNSYVQEMDSLRCTDLLHARAQKLQLPGEVQSNSCRNHGIPDVWLSNSVFSEFFQTVRKQISLYWLVSQKVLFQLHFLSESCDSMRKKYFFSSLSSFVFTLFPYHVVSLTASEELLL